MEGAAGDNSYDEDWNVSFDETHDLEAQPDGELMEDGSTVEDDWEV